MASSRTRCARRVASVLDDARVPTRKISDQLGHAKVSMTQDHYIGRRLTDRQTADILEGLFGVPARERVPRVVPEGATEGVAENG